MPIKKLEMAFSAFIFIEGSPKKNNKRRSGGVPSGRAAVVETQQAIADYDSAVESPIVII